MQNLKIAIPTELFAPAESSSFEGEYHLPEFQAGPDVYRFPEPLHYNVQITNTTGAFLVTGIVEGTGSTECARCLDEFEVPVFGSVEGYFLYSAEEDGEEFEEGEEEEFDLLGPDNTIDLEPLLQAAILVELPLLPLCREDCKGICQDCGINLNEGTCDCAEKRAAQDAADQMASNPFAALAQLKFDAEEIEAAQQEREEAAEAVQTEAAFNDLENDDASIGWNGFDDIPEPPEPDYEGE